jgi:hypothetical protein
MTTDGSATISANGLVVPAPPVITVISGADAPVGGAGSLAGAGVAILSAAPGTGMGHYILSPLLELLVPVQTLSGSYQATMTATIVGF